MTRKKVNKIVDFIVTAQDSSNRYVEIPDVESITAPDVAFADGEISGAGIFGTINRPDIFNIDAMESKVTLNSWSSEAKLLLNPDGVSIKATYAIDSITPEGNSSYDTYTEIIKGWPKSIPGGDRTKGEKISLELTQSVRYYKLIVNGEVRTEISPMNNVLKINGVDYAAKLKAAFNS